MCVCVCMYLRLFIYNCIVLIRVIHTSWFCFECFTISFICVWRIGRLRCLPLGIFNKCVSCVDALEVLHVVVMHGIIVKIARRCSRPIFHGVHFLLVCFYQSTSLSLRRSCWYILFRFERMIYLKPAVHRQPVFPRGGPGEPAITIKHLQKPTYVANASGMMLFHHTCGSPCILRMQLPASLRCPHHGGRTYQRPSLFITNVKLNKQNSIIMQHLTIVCDSSASASKYSNMANVSIVTQNKYDLAHTFTKCRDP